MSFGSTKRLIDWMRMASARASSTSCAPPRRASQHTLDALAADHARRVRIATDVLLAELTRQRLVKADQPHLRGAVRAAARIAEAPAPPSKDMTTMLPAA